MVLEEKERVEILRELKEMTSTTATELIEVKEALSRAEEQLAEKRKERLRLKEGVQELEKAVNRASLSNEQSLKMYTEEMVRR